MSTRNIVPRTDGEGQIGTSTKKWNKVVTDELLASKINTPYTQVVTVAKVGADYITIQGAIDAITDASSSKRYIVQIAPGTYTEAVTLKQGLSLIGMGSAAETVISQTTGDTLTTGSVPAVSLVQNLTIKMNCSGITSGRALVARGIAQIFTNVIFDVDVENGYIDAIDLLAGTSIFLGCTFQYDHTGTGGGSHTFIRNSSSSTFNIESGYCAMNVASIATADYVLFIEDDGTSTGSKTVLGFLCDIVAVTANYDGNVEFWKSTGGTINNNCQGSHIDISTPSGDTNSLGTIYDINSGGLAGEIHSTGNRLSVTGFNVNYFVEVVDATDLIIAHSDDVVAVDEITGSGSFQYATSLVDGEFQISNKLRVGTITDNVTIVEDGTFTLKGLARVLKRELFHGRDMSPGTCGQSTTSNIRVMRFDDTVNEDANISFVIPGDIDLTTFNPILKIHLFPHVNQTTGSQCLMRVNVVRYISLGEAVDKIVDEDNLDNIVPISNSRRVVSFFEQELDRSLIETNDIISFEIERRATSVDDNRNGDIDVFMVEFIYQSNRIG